MKAKIRALAGLVVLALSSPSVMADSDTCTGNGCSAGPLNVTFSVTIPAFVRFQLGAVGSNPDVQFNTGVTEANIGTGPVSADTVINGSGNGTDQVRYALVTNGGVSGVTITAAGVGAGLTSGGNTIPYSTIDSTTTVTSGPAVDMPVVGGAGIPVSDLSGVVNSIGYWNYTFANAAVYPSGTYTGTIEYTATDNP